MFLIQKESKIFMDSNQQLLQLVLPGGVFEYFDVTNSTIDDNSIKVILTEKNLPPLESPSQKVNFRKFHDITITDFPIRGKRCLLTFRRRYWKVEGQDGYLKRDIQLAFPGTKLASEFAAFLKADSGQPANFPEYYRYISESSDK